MLVDTRSDSNFIFEFKKKLTNFCHKAPIPISFFIDTQFKVDIYYHEDSGKKEKIFTLPFEFNKSPKENIAIIKDFLIANHYPVLSEEIDITEKYSPQELNKLVSEGEISLNNLGLKKTVTKQTLWRIEKIITLRDEIFLRNLTTNKCFRYKLKKPVTIFLKKYREESIKNPNSYKKDMYELFENKSILLNEIYDNWKEMQNTEETL